MCPPSQGKKMAFVKIYVDSVLGWVLSLSNNGQ